MEAPQGSRLRVLVIEDEPSLRLLLGLVLAQDANCEILEAEDVDAGLAIAAEERPDVVVLDLNLPVGPQGLDAIAPLKQAAPGCRVVVHSASWPRSDEALARGADAFVLKDIDYAELIEAIRAT